MRTQFDRSAVGSFRVRALTKTFVGICQFAVGIVIRRFGRDSALKLCCSILVMSSPYVNGPQADVCGWEPFVQVQGTLAISPAAFDPSWLPAGLAVLVHPPICLAATSICQGVLGIQLDGGIKNLNSVFNVLHLVVILQVTKPLQVKVVCASHLRAMRL